jgi:hypothetical protein
MIDGELVATYIAKYPAKNSWRRIAREAQVLGCTPVWQLMLGVGIWPGRIACRRRRFRF